MNSFPHFSPRRYCRPARLLAFLGLLLAPATLPGKDHPAASPQEFEAAVKQLKPGDTLTLQDGLWQDADLLLEASGTEQEPITLQAQTPGKVILTGKSRLRIAGEFLVVQGLYFHEAWDNDHLVSFRKDSKRLARRCRLTNCAFIDCNHPGETRECRWISLYGERHRLDHCWVEGKKSAGTTVVVWLGEHPAEHQIDHNYFGPRPPLGKNGGETIRIGDSETSLSSARTLVEFNCFEQCNGEAEIISSKSCDNIFRSNTFRQCSGALTLRHGHRCLVDGNYFLGEKARGTGGVRIIGEDHRVINNYFSELTGDEARAALSIMDGIPNSPLSGYFQVKRAVVAFNTFVHCKESMNVGLVDKDAHNSVPPEDCVIANNLFLARGDIVNLNLRTQPQRFTWTGNLLDQAANVPPLKGFRSTNLHLHESPDGIWRPRAPSPAIDGAQGEFPDIDHDIDGQPRDSRKDVGCDEVRTGPVPGPLTRRDVGPDWIPAR